MQLIETWKCSCTRRGRFWEPHIFVNISKPHSPLSTPKTRFFWHGTKMATCTGAPSRAETLFGVMRLHLQTWAYQYVWVEENVNVIICMYIHIHEYIHIWLYIYIYIHVCMVMWACVSVINLHKRENSTNQSFGQAVQQASTCGCTLLEYWLCHEALPKHVC